VANVEIIDKRVHVKLRLDVGDLSGEVRQVSQADCRASDNDVIASAKVCSEAIEEEGEEVARDFEVVRTASLYLEEDETATEHLLQVSPLFGWPDVDLVH